MMPSSFRAALFALAVSVVAVSAAPRLTVKTSAPDLNADGLENLEVAATITNSGDETLRLLNDPRGVLSPFPENSFTITDATGSRPVFNGAKIKSLVRFPANGVLMLPVSASRPSSPPRTPLALMIPAFSPFFLLALPSISPMIVSGVMSSTLKVRISFYGLIIISFRRVQLHPIWCWRLLHRAIESLHLRRCGRHPQDPLCDCRGCC